MKITKELYNKNEKWFSVLKINEQDALNKDLVELSRLIKKQRDRLALKYHSDKKGDNKSNDELMKELNVAKEKLDNLIEKAKETGNKNATSSPESSSSNRFSKNKNCNPMNINDIINGKYCQKKSEPIHKASKERDTEQMPNQILIDGRPMKFEETHLLKKETEVSVNGKFMQFKDLPLHNITVNNQGVFVSGIANDKNR